MVSRIYPLNPSLNGEVFPARGVQVCVHACYNGACACMLHMYAWCVHVCMLYRYACKHVMMFMMHAIHAYIHVCMVCACMHVIQVRVHAYHHGVV